MDEEVVLCRKPWPGGLLYTYIGLLDVVGVSKEILNITMVVKVRPVISKSVCRKCKHL